MNTLKTVDPITLEILQNKLLTSVQHITERLIRSGYSRMIKEMEDCSAALFDAECRLLAESANIPIHLNCVGICLRSIVECHIPKDQWAPGDIIVTNDPYLGGGSLGSAHANDFVMFAPVFVQDRLIGFAGAMAHHQDIGAMNFGSRGWNVDIQQEGLLIPPMKLVDNGKRNDAIMEIILRNTRTPEAMRNDILAQIASVNAGGHELAIVHETYGEETMAGAVNQMIQHAEKRSRQEISAIPDGVYRSEVPILDDGFAGGPYWLRLAIHKTGDEILFDFDGTDPQVKGPVNAPLSTTLSAIYYIMRCLTDPSMPNSEGCKAPIKVKAPEGTLVNARRPAAVYQRMVVCHSLVDLVMGALAEAIPDRVIADSCGCQYNNGSAFDPIEQRYVAWGEVTPGGLGATRDLDGIDVMSCHVTNTVLSPVEATEIEAPVLFLGREYQCDTGGAGRRRGGMGQVVTWQVLVDEAELTHTSQKSQVKPRGFEGGLDGASGYWVINEGRPDERKLEHVIGEAKPLSKNETVTFYTTAGGGFGDPRQRERSKVLADLRDGLISERAAREVYGQDV